MMACSDVSGIVRGVVRLGFLLLAPGLLCAGVVADETASPGAPLLAHWAFDAGFGGACPDAGGNGFDAAPQRTDDGAVTRTGGLFGQALLFSGTHRLVVSNPALFDGATELTLAVWVLPTELGGYRELFRKEDGEQRVLFSFQDDGAILSLGLHVDGYFECDALLEPAAVLDGAWHHCAATFDGRFARVYLDGNEIGAVERPGKAVWGGSASACIGSLNGGECFQGAMDDLRLYGAALSAEAIAELHARGANRNHPDSPPEPAGEPGLDRRPLAHWTFNETGPYPRVWDLAGDRALLAAAGHSLVRAQGVYGSALALRGEHALRLDRFGTSRLPALTLAAWVRPHGLSGFREIFRQESANRLLFSFQENGAILSFGLDVGGYIECDAPVDAGRVLDGAWHHCAATFDGQHMRVFLDGEEAGSLERPGTIALQPDAPAFIGSSGGDCEHFQGLLDDLRVYPEALSPDEIAALHRDGADALAKRYAAVHERLAGIYPANASFSDTCAALRERLAHQAGGLDDECVDALSARLKNDFPEASAQFAEWTGVSVIEYVLTAGAAFHDEKLGWLMELLLEYRPITEDQWRRQSPEDRTKWEEADRLRERYEALKARGEAARFSGEWVDLIMAAGSRIDFRPYVQEAVAPYVRPSTPETRTRPPGEAREALEKDWLHQAGGIPAPERILAEIAWARELAARISAAHPGAAGLAEPLARLDALEAEARALTAPSPALYFEVRDAKRAIAFANPVIDFTTMLFVDMPFPQGSEWPHETRHRLGYMAVPGGKLVILEGLHPGGEVRQLVPQAPLHGSFWRPDVSYDASKVLFCFKPHNEKSFHLYEIRVDGSGFTQLTDGPYDDLDPIYLSDEEHIVFSTTRGNTYVRCMPPTSAFVLARCDRDGRNIYLISANNEPDYLPSVMHDGRIIYTRWEYTDKPLWRAQSLWTVNPDGTQSNTFWGNQSVWPDLLKDARAIPGSRRVMFTGSAHHNWFSGSVGIVDPDRGFNFPHGLTKVTADVAWPECGNGPVDPIESPNYHSSGAYGGYYSPYPLSETDFIVSADRGGQFVVYLMDVYGNRELIYEGSNQVFHAIPLRPRPRPPVVVERTELPGRMAQSRPQEGVIYSANVYHGAPAELRGMARYLRILNIDPKTYTYWHKRPYISTGPVVSAVQSEGVKRILGTVPVEADGSVSFVAPAGMALHFQLLDERYRALQTMRSFVNVMPGESRGCLGCHELHSKAPEVSSRGLALNRAPSAITPPPWTPDTVSYPRYVRPVLDRYCAPCHEGDGKGRAVFDLTERPSTPVFTEPYLTLIGRPSWGAPYAPPENPPPGWGIAGQLMVEAYSTTDPEAYKTPKPMTALSYKSRLIEIASSGDHHGVEVDSVSLQRLIAWVDAMCPYQGEEEVRAIPDPDFQGIDWLAVRPRIATAPEIVRPGPVD